MTLAEHLKGVQVEPLDSVEDSSHFEHSVEEIDERLRRWKVADSRPGESHRYRVEG